MAGPASRLDEVGRLIARLADDAPAPNVIRAYHGSPYDWDRVDMSMATKGEGPLLQGFGLYTTADPNTANWYRHRISRIRRSGLAGDMRAARAAGDQSALASARALAEKLQGVQPHGRTYELEVDYPPSALLDYDAPISKQSPAVQEAIARLFPHAMDDAEALTGGRFYHDLAGGSVFANAPIAAQRKASEALFRAGIPGHTYDHGGANYVFYPGAEDQIRILRKFAIPGVVGTGAAAMSGEE